MRLLIAVVYCFAFPVSAASATELEKLVLQWLALEQQANAIEQKWREQEPLLQQQIALLQQEKQQLQELLNQDSSSQDDVTQQRQHLLTQQDQLERNQSSLHLALEQNYSQLTSLKEQLPPPLQAKWQKDLLAYANANGSSEKLELQLAMFNSAADFNQRIAVNKDPMWFNGEEREVKQFFLGVAFGYYVTADGVYWGRGYSRTNGWHWQSQPASVSPQTLLSVLTMLEDPSSAKWMQLPIHTNNLQEYGGAN